MEQPALVVTETEDAAKKDQTPLWQLAEAGDLDRVKIALNNGAQVNEVGPGGSTPLMLAVGGRHNAVAWIFLLHPELDPNLQHVEEITRGPWQGLAGIPLSTPSMQWTRKAAQH